MEATLFDTDIPTASPSKSSSEPRTTQLQWAERITLVFFAIIIVSSGALLFMLLVTDWIVPADPDLWIEINSQILNAVFTILSLASHPFRLRMQWALWKAPVPRDARRLTAYTLLNINVFTYLGVSNL